MGNLNNSILVKVDIGHSNRGIVGSLEMDEAFAGT